jgi:hypothetical protein
MRNLLLRNWTTPRVRIRRREPVAGVLPSHYLSL